MPVPAEPRLLPEPLRLSRNQEQRIARKTGGRLNAGSGNQWRRKGDVRESSDILWEMKRTNAKSITIKLADLEKVRKEAALDGRRAVMHIELGTRRYVIIEEDDYFE